MIVLPEAVQMDPERARERLAALDHIIADRRLELALAWADDFDRSKVDKIRASIDSARQERAAILRLWRILQVST